MLRRVDAQLFGHVLGDLDVEAGERAVGVLQAQPGLVELDPDDELAVLGAGQHLRIGRPPPETALCTELTALLARLATELAALCAWLATLCAALATELADGVLELLQPETDQRERCRPRHD